MKSYEIWVDGAEFDLLSCSKMKKKIVIMNGVKIANVFYGTNTGHTQFGCGHNFDAQKFFLFLRFLSAHFNENCHGLPLVIVLIRREKKIGKKLGLGAKLNYANWNVRIFMKLKKIMILD